MPSSRLVLAGLILSAPLLAAQTSGPAPGKFILGLSAIQVVPLGDLVNEGRIGLGTDFQLLRAVHERRLFVGLDLRLGGVGPAYRVVARDATPLAFDQKDRAQNSLTSISVPVRYILGAGPIRPYLTASVGAAIWGVKSWNERGNESPRLFPNTHSTHLEFSEGIGFVAQARETWLLDLGFRHAMSGTVNYLQREGFASVNGKTVYEPTALHPQVLIFTIGVNALIH